MNVALLMNLRLTILQRKIINWIPNDQQWLSQVLLSKIYLLDLVWRFKPVTLRTWSEQFATVLPGRSAYYLCRKKSDLNLDLKLVEQVFALRYRSDSWRHEAATLSALRLVESPWNNELTQLDECLDCCAPWQESLTGGSAKSARAATVLSVSGTTQDNPALALLDLWTVYT